MTDRDPVYSMSVAARLCGVHPQTLRSYERLDLVTPARVNDKNRMYSEFDIRRVHQIQRLTQDLGVNLAGVEVILKLLDQMEDMRQDLESQMLEYVRSAEERLAYLAKDSKAPVLREGGLLPTPKLIFRKKWEI